MVFFKVCLNNIRDLQLALLIVRLYVNDAERQLSLCKSILAQAVFGLDNMDNFSPDDLNSGASTDPFVRSMAFWWIK